MTAVSNVQTNFLGGLWSKFAQGRYDHPRYKSALNECLNGYPTEEGAWTRRPGLRMCAYTHQGRTGRVISFTFDDTTPYSLELTQDYMRLFSGYSLVFDQAKVYTVTAISGATPAVVTTSATNNVQTGNEVQFDWSDDLTTSLHNPTICAVLKNRQFIATRINGTTFSLVDALTGTALDGSTVNFNAGTVPTKVGVLIGLTTPYLTGDIGYVNIVRNEQNAVLLHGSYAPQLLTITPNLSTAYVSADASFTVANLKDGPYLDAITGGAFVIPQLADTTKPNVVQLNVNFPTWDVKKPYNLGDLVQDPDGAFQSLVDSNLGNDPLTNPAKWAAVDAGIINGPGGFTSGDIGRMVRLYSIPPLFDITKTYAVGDAVTLYNSVDKTYAFYVSTAATNLGNTPDGDSGLANWLPSTSTDIARWTWGKIIAVGSGTTPRMTVNIYGDPLLYFYNGDPNTKIFGIRLGVYGGGAGYGWPTNGTYHEGRLWLTGAKANRFDSSNSNDFLNFAPTAADGTVADNHAVAAELNASDVNRAYWMESTDTGILVGTKGGEWRLSSSNLDDPLTPTSIRARRVTRYGCADVQPIRAGFALLFVQKFRRAVYELIAETFTNRIVGQNLSSMAKNLGKAGFNEITYQREQTPMFWTRDDDNALFGCTYRRTSLSSTEEPSFFAWHRHSHGAGRIFSSIAVGPSDKADIDMLTTVTNDGSTYAVEFLTALFDEDAPYTRAWFMDFATGAAGAVVATVGGKLGLQIYGLWPHNGTSPSFMIGGINCGTAAVASGTAFVPFGTYDGVAVNLAYIQSLDAAWTAGTIDFGDGGTIVNNSGSYYACQIVAGWPYTSRGQRLRPVAPEETGAQAGPGFAKIRRNHLAGVHLHNTTNGKFKWGTNFAQMRAPSLTTPGGTSFTAAQLYSGIYRTTIDDTYSFDGQLAWQIDTPYPATVLAIGGFIQTQDQ